jgi:glycosyltransferase involved in cell wall biosynthesis
METWRGNSDGSGQQMNPDISVIIPVFNQAQFVGEAIESALVQTRSPLEVIVVDDGSTDGTPEVLQTFAPDPRVRLIRQQNGGVAVARNAGAAAASGQFFAFLDADDIWLPGKLERQRERFANEPDLSLVHCGVEEFTDKDLPGCERVDGMEGSIAPELLFFNRTVLLGGGSGVMVSAKLFIELGGFDGRMSTSADWDFFYRCASRGPVGFLPEVLLRYRIHGSNMHRNVRAMRHDMLLGFAKAFASADRELRRRRRYAYGRLHTVLAGSFWGTGDRREALKHALKAIWYRPASALQMLGGVINSR